MVRKRSRAGFVAGQCRPALAAIFYLGLMAANHSVAALSQPSFASVNLAHDQTLTPGRPINRKIAAAGPVPFSFHAPAQSLFRLSIWQRDLRVHITVLRPDGATLLERVTPLNGETPVVSAASQEGTYRVIVTPELVDDRSRSLSICLQELTGFHQRSLKEVSAGAAVEAGDRLAGEWTQASLDASLAQYKRAELDWRSAGVMDEASVALVRQGEIRTYRGSYRPALTAYRTALQLLSNQAPVQRRIDILNSMARLALSYTEVREATQDSDTAYKLSQSSSDEDGLGRALTDLAEEASIQLNETQARSDLEQAQMIWSKVADRGAEATTMTVSAFVRAKASDYAGALEDLTSSLRIARSLNNKFEEATNLANIGNNYVHMNELNLARSSYSDALAILESIGCTYLQALVLDDYGYYLDNIGDPSSYQFYLRAGRLAKESGDILLSATVFSDLSHALLSQKKPALALQYGLGERQIGISLHDGLLEGQALRDAGEAYLASGKANLALNCFLAALEPGKLPRNSTVRASARIETGRALETLGRSSDALGAYQEAAALSHSLGAARVEADARFHIAQLESRLGRLDSALPEIENSVALVEALRARVSPDDSRVSWFASFHAIYTLFIDVLMQTSLRTPGSDLARRAFQIAEQSKARSFVELLHQAGVSKGNVPDLSREDANVRRLLAEKTDEASQLLLGSADPDEIRKVAAEISDLHDRAARLESSIQSQDADYFQMQIDPLDVDQVQALLGQEDIVLEYALGGSRSYLWAISRNGFSSYELPPADQIEPLVRRFRQAILSPYSPGQRGQREARAVRPMEGELPLARALGSMLLAPVEGLSGFKHVVIVADGVLQYLPFTALTTESLHPDTSGAAGWFCNLHEVVSLPSMTALSVLRKRSRQNVAPTRGLLVFADPVFERDDPRVDAVAAGRRADVSIRTLKQDENSGGPGAQAYTDLPRLPGTRQEAESIAAEAQAADSEILLGFEANRDRAISPEAGDYAILHFATHSLFDDEHPENSAVVLSEFRKDGSPVNGSLELKDVYGLRLSANLVVLSACETALGKDIQGEGIVGLTRGFLFAGAPHVVATLWRVDDEASSEFMKWFYKGIFQQHLSPADALHEAQMKVKEQPRWSSPYYWSAFVLEGDWR